MVTKMDKKITKTVEYDSVELTVAKLFFNIKNSEGTVVAPDNIRLDREHISPKLLSLLEEECIKQVK